MTERVTRRSALKGVAGVAGLGSLAGCASVLGGGGGKLTVSSKQFTEQELLGSMTYVTLKENTDLQVKDQVGLGGTTTNFKALKEGQVDVYWEYTGTAWATLPPKHDKVITDPQKIYDKVESDFEDEYDITFLDRAPFNNTYVLVANPDWVKKTGVKTLSGFAEYVNGGNTDFTVVMDAEFQNRADGWPGLAKHYGFDDAAGEINVKNVGAGLTYQIVGNGEAAVGMGFNTNPKILKFDLTVLEDDEKFFPVYNPAPMVSQKTLEKDQSMKEPLNALAPKLTTDKIRNLNKRVSIGGEGAKSVAREFLKSEGLL